MRIWLAVLLLCWTAMTSAIAKPRGYIGLNVAVTQPVKDFADENPYNEGGGAALGPGIGLEGGLSSKEFDFYLAWRVGRHNAECKGEIPNYASTDASGVWTIQQWVIGERMHVVQLSKTTDFTAGAGILLATAKGVADGRISNSQYHYVNQVFESATSDLTGGFIVDAGLCTALSKNAQIRCNVQYQRFEPRFDTKLWTGTLEMEYWSLQIGFSGFLNWE